MGKKFNNINEELDRIKTLMFETDSIILNERTVINEQTTPPAAPAADDKFKTQRSSFKLAKISDVNTVLRGGAAKFPTYKVKGTGAMNLFDKDGKMTPEGIALMKKSGLNLPAGQIIIRIGKVDDPNTDKVFFQVVPTQDISVVTKSGDIKNVSTKELEQLPTVQDLKPTPTPASVASATTPSPTDKFVETMDFLKGKKIDELAKQFNLKIKDITPEFKKMGWTASAYYKKNEETKSVYGTDADGGIKSLFKRMSGGATTKGVSESFNMDLVFVNPLLFESVISEQEAGGESDYYVKIDSNGKETKMKNTFTQVVDGTYKGGTSGGGGSTSGGGGSTSSVDKKSDWDNYPCVTNNTNIKKVTDPKMGVMYEDGGNFYYSNGRYRDKKSGKMGNFSCSGDKIVSDKSSASAGGTKPAVVTDADLMGETGVLRNLMKSAAVIAAVSAIIAPIGVPFLLLTAGASAAFNQVSRRSGVKGVVDALDNIVTQDDLAYVLATIKGLNNKFYNDEEIGSYVPATKRFLELYSEDEGGDDLIADVQSVGTRTLPTGTEKLKSIIVKTINTQANATVPAELTSSGVS